jgi:inactivated superfamily I helicase
MAKPILNEKSQLTEESLEDIIRLASVMDCECPRYLVKILEGVREFKEYEKNCAISHEKDRQIHHWLEGAADNLDRMISTTISQLARMEGMIDEDNCIVPMGHASPK